jgi:hypothetical protein
MAKKRRDYKFEAKLAKRADGMRILAFLERVIPELKRQK